MAKKTAVIAGVTAAVVVAAGVGGYFAWQNFSGGVPSEGAVYVQEVRACNLASLSITNRYSGKVESQETKEVKKDASKTVAETYVAEGEVVNEGDPLFIYDTDAMALDLQQGQLEIDRLNNSIVTSNSQITELEAERKKASSSEQLSYTAQIQQLQTDIATAEYDIKVKQTELDKLQNAIDNATVFAPIGGTVEDVATDEEISMSESGAYITILASGDLRVKGSVSETNIYEIYEGEEVIVRSRIDDAVWTGVVSTIDTSQPESNDTMYYYSSGESASTYAFYVQLDNADNLMMGQHVTIEPDYGLSDLTGIWLSSGQLVFDENGENPTVWMRGAGDRLVSQPVVVGEYNEIMDAYEITEGLTTGDYIAWPDVDCQVGAATTTEIILNEEEISSDEFMGDEGMMDEGIMDEGMLDEGMLDEGMVDEGMIAEEVIDGEVSAETAAVDGNEGFDDVDSYDSYGASGTIIVG